MLKPADLRKNYFQLLEESERISGMKPASHLFKDFPTTEPEDSFSNEQWGNMVKVASLVKANQNRFSMKTWHDQTDCGTCHCIAGWAEALSKNDTNFSNSPGDRTEASSVGLTMLSEYSYPFFWLTDVNLFRSPISVMSLHQHLSGVSNKGLAERLVMKWYVDPILEEARRESHDLTSEMENLIANFQTEPALV